MVDDDTISFQVLGKAGRVDTVMQVYKWGGSHGESVEADIFKCSSLCSGPAIKRKLGEFTMMSQPIRLILVDWMKASRLPV